MKKLSNPFTDLLTAVFPPPSFPLIFFGSFFSFNKKKNTLNFIYTIRVESWVGVIVSPSSQLRVSDTIDSDRGPNQSASRCAGHAIIDSHPSSDSSPKLDLFPFFLFRVIFLIIKNKKEMKKKKKRKTDRENQIKLVKQKTEKWRRNPFHSCWKRCVRSSLFSTRVVIWKFIFLAATFYIRGEKIRPKYLTPPIYTQTHRHTHG